MSNDEHSQALARWLERPEGTEPPGILDDEVVEAIYALRPELAPAPRVDVDDILALVTTGPLAMAESSGGEVVPFPGAAAPAEEAPEEEAVDWSSPNAPPRWSSLAWLGGTSSIGLVLAAAATLMVVALPAMQGDMAPSPQAEDAPASQELRAPAAAKAERADTGLRAPAEEANRPQAKSKPRSRPAAAPPPKASAPKAPQRAQAPVYEMGGAPVPDMALIPELSDQADGVAEAEPMPSPEDALAEQEAAAPAGELDLLRGQAEPTDWSKNGWQAQVSGSDRQRVSAMLDTAMEASQAGDYADAGDIAARGITPPNAAAHAAALAALNYYLVAGDTGAAAAAAQRGLQFRSNTAGWSKLAVGLGDLLRASDPEGAATWYRDAAAFNAAR